MQRNIVITGCSSGFGKILVQLFLQKGWLVIAGMRRASERQAIFAKELQTFGSNLQIIECDVANAGSVEAFCREVQRLAAGGLHCLVNNAGVGSFGAGEETPTAELRATMDTNFFGTVAITRQLLPLLRAAEGHIIVLSSIMGLIGFPLSSSYCASKFALEGYFESLYYELAAQGVKVCLVEPGGHRTDFFPNAKYSEADLLQSSPYQSLTVGYKTMQQRLAQRKPVPPEAVCQRVMALVEMPQPPLRSYCGKDAQGLRLMHALVPRNLLVRYLRALYLQMLTKMAAKGK